MTEKAQNTLGGVTDINGYFTINNVPVGRSILRISYVGYEPMILPNVEVTSGKDVILNITIEESISKLNEVVVTAEKDQAATQQSTKDFLINSCISINCRHRNNNSIKRMSSRCHSYGLSTNNKYDDFYPKSQ